MLNIQIGDLVLPTRFVVSDNITEPMLGVEWLRCNQMTWDFAKDILIINGKVFHLIPGEKTGSCRHVVATEKVIIPPRSQAIVPGKDEMSRMYGEPDDGVWTTEVSELENGVNLARAILPARLDDLPILVLNVSNESCEINAETVLTKLSLATCAGNSAESALTADEGDRSYKHMSKLHEGVDDRVSEEQRVEVIKILREYADVFSTGEHDLGETTLAAHQIDTGDARPIRQTMRRQPFHLLDKIDEYVVKMVEAGVIEPSCSPWTSNIAVVSKKNGSLRFCVDYRKLNSVTRRDAYPLPRIDSCLDALSGAQFFSAFEMRSSYHQVPMDIKNADKTTFIVRTGTYRFRRVPFGLCNAGSTFQRVMDLALNCLNFNMCLVYLDDIIVYSSTVEIHMICLRKLFDRLRAVDLKLKPSKCSLLRAEVSFLGHVVSGEGVSTDPGKIVLVRDWPTPGDVKEVRSFLGLASYYRRFVPTFAEIAAPLHALTAKNKLFEWTSDCDRAFVRLKLALISSPILAMPNDADPFLLDTDACDVSIGAILSQIQSGVERVIAYASRSLSKPERNYCVTRRELLAIVCYTETFRHYLLGRQFVIRTDHSALQWLRTTPEPIGQ